MDRAGEGPYLPRLRFLRTRAGGRGPEEHLHGGADIAMRYVNCDSASEVTLVLSPEEAKTLGLHALRDRPEAS